MEFRDLKAQYTQHKEAIDAALLKTAAEAHYIGGGAVGELERALASYVGAKHCISCANGTDALQLALMVWGIGAGDAVFVPDFTFFSSGEVVPLTGAVPVFADICEDTFNLDPDSLEAAIRFVREHSELRPRAVVAVDLFGLPAEHTKIRALAERYGLLVLEDAAQGFGGQLQGRYACSFGDISTTSFFPAKPLGCYGDGGALFTDNDEWAELLRSLKVHGKGADKYDNIRIGLNSRLDTLQAAVLLEKLRFFEEEIEKCEEAAQYYTALFAQNMNAIKTPRIPAGFRSSWAQYTILLENETVRAAVMEALKAAGIPSMIYYKKPMHLQKAFEPYRAYQPDACPVSTDVSKRCLSLPMSAYLFQEDIERIVEVCCKI